MQAFATITVATCCASFRPVFLCFQGVHPQAFSGRGVHNQLSIDSNFYFFLPSMFVYLLYVYMYSYFLDFYVNWFYSWAHLIF